MGKYFVCWNGAIDSFDDLKLAELVYDSRFEAGVSPLFFDCCG